MQQYKSRNSLRRRIKVSVFVGDWSCLKICYHLIIHRLTLDQCSCNSDPKIKWKWLKTNVHSETRSQLLHQSKANQLPWSGCRLAVGQIVWIPLIWNYGINGSIRCGAGFTPLFFKVETSCKTQHNTQNLHDRSRPPSLWSPAPHIQYQWSRQTRTPSSTWLSLSLTFPAFSSSFQQLI